MLLMGARCNPTPPACKGDTVCPSDQLEVCLDQCVTPAERGEECSSHPCDGSGLPPCGPNLVCDADPDGPSGRNICQPFISPFDQFWCRTYDPERSCPTGQYCRGFETAVNQAMRCPGLLPTEGVTPPLYDGVCSLPTREGRECDGNWGDVGACHACEPGTECRDDVPGWNGARVCVRACSTSGDCPCPSTAPNVLDQCTDVPASDDRVCTNCVAITAECDSGASWGCCDAGATCAGGRCCFPSGAACTDTAQCCGTALCGSDGSCHGCTTGGEPVDRKGPGCCRGEPDAGGMCPRTCLFRRANGSVVSVVEGDSCTARTCAGTYVCDEQGGTATCVPTDPSPEVFDCVDNDCDGRVDEGADPSCMGRPLAIEALNFDGCPNLEPLPGMLTCVRGEPVCRIRTGWCAWDELGNPIDRSGIGEQCFSGGSGDCGVLGCHAGEWCCATNPMARPYCQEIGRIEGVPLPGYPHPPPCWLPDTFNTDFECPAPDQCMGHSGCDDCVADDDCGYCAGYHTCLPGDDAGPSWDVDLCGEWIREAAMCGP